MPSVQSASGAMSYASGVSSVPHLGETIGQRLDSVVAGWGDRTALVVRQQRITWSWRELDARAEAFAAGLLALGLAPGDRIGIWSPNNAEWVLTMFAAAKAGLVLVTINPAYRPQRAGIRAEQGRLPRLGHRHQLQDQRLRRHAPVAGAGTGDLPARPAGGREAAASRNRHPDRRRHHSRCARLRRCGRHWARRPRWRPCAQSAPACNSTRR